MHVVAWGVCKIVCLRLYVQMWEGAHMLEVEWSKCVRMHMYEAVGKACTKAGV